MIITYRALHARVCYLQITTFHKGCLKLLKFLIRLTLLLPKALDINAARVTSLCKYSTHEIIIWADTNVTWCWQLQQVLLFVWHDSFPSRSLTVCSITAGIQKSDLVKRPRTSMLSRVSILLHGEVDLSLAGV